MRVVSLLPSATEIVCAMGAGSQLVGRSSECDYPPEVARLPAVMRPRTLDTEAPSRTIDERVRAARGSGESLYWLDIPALTDLRPDLLLTQDLCGVCSVTESEVVSACREAGVHPQILSLTPRRLREVWESIDRIGEALGRADAAARLRQTCELRAEGRAHRPADPPTVAVLEWLDPVIEAGLWTPDLVTAAGGRPARATAGMPGVRSDWGSVREADPAAVILSPCSFTVERTRLELARGAWDRELARLSPRHGIWLADEAYFSRPGPRLAEGARLIASLLDGREPPADAMPTRRWAEVSA